MYRRYETNVFMAGELFCEVWIDPHYEQNHKTSINDLLILELVTQLNSWLIVLSTVVGDYTFYEANGSYNGKMYRLILVVPADKSYLGVRNAYRRNLK